MNDRRSIALIVTLLVFAISLGVVRSMAECAQTPNTLNPPPGDGPVVVRAAFHLLNINEIDDEKEAFEFTGLLSLRWTDTRLAFDPEKVGANEQVYTGEFQFNETAPSWYPEVILLNTSGMYEKYGTVLRVRSDGRCLLIQMINAAAESKLDLRHYPYDHQRLEAVFKVLGLGANEVRIVADPEHESDFKRGIRITQWEFKRMSISSREVKAPFGPGSADASTVILSVDVFRKRWFVVRLIVIPLILIVVLSWSVFWMDRSSLGDRMSVSFVGILASVTYQLMIGDILPKISYYTPMHAFLNMSFFLMCLTVAVNLLVGTCDKAGNARLGDRIDRHCRWIFPIAYLGILAIIVTVAYL